MMRSLGFAAILLLLAACAGSPPQPAFDAAAADDEAVTADLFEAIRGQPPLLQAYVRRFPKGADLHNHLSGAVYAESYIARAAATGMCFDGQRQALVPPRPPCDARKGRPPVAGADGALRGRMIDALSMRNFVPGETAASGRDQFFATFSRFGAAGDDWGPMLAEAVQRAAENGAHHLELMVSPDRGRVRAVARRLTGAGRWTGDLDGFQAALAPELPALAAAASAGLDQAEARKRAILECDAPKPKPGCAVSVRYIAQVVRLLPPDDVFAQTVMAFELVRADPRIVAINFVGAEDDGVALRDYRQHMRMIAHLRRQHPGVAVALHAGELSSGMVPPEDLRFHIREAVEVAGARRIGHGVAIMHEDDAIGRLETMARRGVLVEINLTSNDLILGVAGASHPFTVYRRFGVPVAISTDDEGVSRSELTQEFVRAIRDFGLGYHDLKTLARNSLTYSFLPGDSLWDDGPWDDGRPRSYVDACEEAGAACAAFLAGSEKARAQWRLEAAFAAYEEDVRRDVERHPYLLSGAAGADQP